MQPADRGHGPAGGARGQRRMVGVALPQSGKELGDIGLDDVGQRGPAAGVEQLRVAVQIAAVGRQRVGRQPAFDGKVVEVTPDARLDRRDIRQRSTESSATESRPCASATEG